MNKGDLAWIIGTIFFATLILGQGIDAANKNLRRIIELLNDIKHGRRD